MTYENKIKQKMRTMVKLGSDLEDVSSLVQDASSTWMNENLHTKW